MEGSEHENMALGPLKDSEHLSASVGITKHEKSQLPRPDEINEVPSLEGPGAEVFEDVNEHTQQDGNAVALERWNNPKINIYRYFAALYSFLVMGMNDASYGALVPYLERYYDLSYIVLSLIFLAPLGGFILAALVNHKIHTSYGQVGCAILGPSCYLIAYVVSAVHPPYPVLPFAFMIAGLGTGILDAAWNAWIGNMISANELLGFLHAAFGLGAALGPLIATALVTKANLEWYSFYYVMIGLAAIALSACWFTFRQSTGAVYQAANPVTHLSSGQSPLKQSLFSHITWICAFFCVFVVGIEVVLGGWLVDFMLRVRHGAPFASGLVATGFWLGLTIGRMTLGFVTGRLGEKIAITAYLLACMGLELCFWLIPNFISSAIFAGWMGFFLGPLIPAVVVVATKLLPQRLHVSAVGFAVAFGGTGGAIFPFALGAIAQSKGVQVLQPISFALLVVNLALWCLLPGGFTKRGLEEVSKERNKRNNDTNVATEPGSRSGLRRHLQMFTKKVNIA